MNHAVAAAEAEMQTLESASAAGSKSTISSACGLTEHAMADVKVAFQGSAMP